MDKILYMAIPLMLLCLGYTIYQDSLTNQTVLSSGRGQYIPNLFCAIEVDAERSIRAMEVDFEECKLIHKQFQKDRD